MPLLALGLLFLPVADELDRRLAELSAPRGEVRHQAERWLAAHVGPEDGARIGAAALGGDAEVRVRLARVVAAADRSLVLSTDFLTSTQPALADLGTRALETRIARWSTRAREPGLTGTALSLALERTAQRSWPQTVQLPVTGTLAEACALLARRSRVPIGLVVSPSVAGRRTTAGAPFVLGTWDEVAAQIAQRFEVALEGHDLREDREGAGPAAFLRFCPVAEAGRRTQAELLIEWCREVSAGATERGRVLAANALSGARWPDAIDWLAERRRASTQDQAALAGLLSAAAEGRVSPSLATPDSVRALLGRAAAAWEGGEEERRLSFSILDALRNLPNLTAEGTSVGAVLGQGWEGTSEGERWLRLAMLEGIGAPEGVAPALAVLTDPDATGVLLEQALRTHAAATAGRGGDAVVIAAPEKLFARPRDLADLLELARLLAREPLVLPETWRLSAAEDVTGTLLLAATFALRGDVEAVEYHWRRLAGGSEPGTRASSRLGELLDELASEAREALVLGWRRARSTGDHAREVDRAAMLGGIVPPERFDEVAGALLTGPGPFDLELLAAVAGGSEASPVSLRARGTLTALLTEAAAGGTTSSEALPLLVALERAVNDLRRRAWSDASGGPPGTRGAASWSAWRAEILGLRLRHPRSPLWNHLSPGWPPPLPARVVDLARLDRRPPR